MPAPAEVKDKPAEQPDQSSQNELSFVGKFIDRYYLQQRPWVQSATFLLFVLLFAYGFVSSVSGSRVIKGNLWVQSPCTQGSCSSYGSFYELRWGTQEFVSNSRGEYYVTLSFMEYLKMLGTGSHPIIFLKNGQVVANETLTFNRLEGEFSDVTLPVAPAAENVTPASLNEDFSLIPTVLASAPQGKYRLVVEGIRMAGGQARSDADLSLLVQGNTVPMKDRAHQDLPTGHIPLAPNVTLDLGSSYYFSVPGLNSLPINGQLKLVTAGGFFQFYSNREETFSLPAQQTLGQSLQLKGSNGSTVTVRVVYDNEVKLFRQSDIAGDDPGLEPGFLNQGLLVHWSESPLGKGQTRETNALWTGPGVPFDVVQKLLQVALSEKIPLKKIQYQYHFASTNNPNEIQFGSSPACIGAGYAPVAESTLHDAIDAKTENDFKRIIAPANDCKTTVQMRKIKPVGKIALK